MIMKRILLSVALSATMTICLPGFSQKRSFAQRRQLQPVLEGGGGTLINDVDRSAVALHPATPYIEASTMMLADIDLEKIDVEATSQWLQQLLGEPQADQDDPGAAMVRGFIDSMKGAGAKHLIATAATRSTIDGGPVVILPCENPAVVNGLLTVLLQNAPKNSPQKVHVGDKIVLAGAATAIDRVTAVEGVDRPDLILPLKRVGELDHNLVIAMPAEARRDLMALWPDRMPNESPIQFSPRAMAADISYVVVSLRLPPDPEMLVHIESPDAIAANRVKETLEEAVALGGDVGPAVEITTEVATVSLRASPEAFAKIVMAIAAPSRKRASQMMTTNTMKQVGLAIHNYYAKEKHLPPLYFTDNDGKPLLSVRVALLPYIEQLAMYNAIRLDEAWDSDGNRQYSATLIPTYCDDPDLKAKTTIRFPVYPGSLWHGQGPPKDFRDVTDGISNTIAAIQAPDNAAIEWANPKPWILSVDDPMSDVFGDRDSAAVVLLDGAAIVLKKSDMTNQKLRALLTIAGGEKDIE
jgi:hypothetical protein